MAPKKLVPMKRKRSGLSSRAPPPLLNNPEKFISRDAERFYHESLFNRTFIPEQGFPNSNAYFNFTIQERGWTKFCEHLLPRIALVVCEFHSNLRFRVDSTVYVRGKWVDFSAAAINQVYDLVDDDSEAYRALFQNTDYQQLMWVLTRGVGE